MVFHSCVGWHLVRKKWGSMAAGAAAAAASASACVAPRRRHSTAKSSEIGHWAVGTKIPVDIMNSNWLN